MGAVGLVQVRWGAFACMTRGDWPLPKETAAAFGGR
jgi:hypothetical protein